MKFIKTFWPSIENPYDKNYNPKIKREPLYQFILSSLLLMEHHPTELYTDSEGFKIIEDLKVPFKKVHILQSQSLQYRALNDLYVLSLQDESSTLVGDEVLVMEKLDITSKDSVVTFMGMDLNSVKLVKALIKIYRVTTDIPYLDDSYWTSKDGYIDASILTFPENTVIKSYYFEVQRFIERYAEQLFNIENGVIDDFLKRYWLYSYLKQKNYEIELLVKDTQSGFSLDGFGFSKKNTLEGIFKIGDFNYLNLEFSLHFFQFFKLRFPEIFEAVETYLNKNVVKGPDRSNFIRVRQFLKKYTDPEGAKYNGTAKSIKTIIKDLQEPDRSFLKDIFKYEDVLRGVNKTFVKNLHAISLQQRQAFSQMVQNWDISETEFKKLKIVVNPQVYLHESKWKWSTLWVDGVPRDKIAQLKVSHNFLNAPGYYITAFVPQVGENIYEFDIDKFSAEIISHFFSVSTINDFIKYIVKNRDQLKSINALESFYNNRIRDLLKINILYFEK